MARAVRHYYTKATTSGKVSVPCQNWYVKWYDAVAKKTKKSPTEFSDKKLAERHGRQMENDAELRAAGMTAPTRADPSASVDGAIREFEQHLVDKQVTRKQIDRVLSNLRRYSSKSKVLFVSDISEQSLRSHLSAIRRAGLSARTRNHIVRNTKQFSRWLTRRKTLSSDPIADVALERVDDDRRYVRRAMPPQEFAKLFDATWKSKIVRHGLTGHTRAMLYMVAVCTGLRRCELASLTVGSVRLGKQPTITVQAAHSKRRREDVLPCDSVKQLAAFVKGRATASPLFELTYTPKDGVKKLAWVARSAKMLAADMEVAGLEVVDDRGRVADLHSLRVSCITELIRQGVPLVTVQKFARHSSPLLTANVYTDTTSEDMVVAGKSLRFGR